MRPQTRSALSFGFVAAAERLADLLPRSTLAIVADAGHTVHLERPDAFLEILEDWLEAT